MTKTDFILKHSNLSAAEVVALAKKNKMSMTDKYVYNVRSKAKTANGAPRRKRGRPPASASGAAPRVAAKATADTDESAFLGLVVSIGTTRAAELLAGLSARLRG